MFYLIEGPKGLALLFPLQNHQPQQEPLLYQQPQAGGGAWEAEGETIRQVRNSLKTKHKLTTKYSGTLL